MAEIRGANRIKELNKHDLFCVLYVAFGGDHEAAIEWLQGACLADYVNEFLAELPIIQEAERQVLVGSLQHEAELVLKNALTSDSENTRIKAAEIISKRFQKEKDDVDSIEKALKRVAHGKQGR